ncbi:MAG TPA: tetratricopeptide repeat protein, partial [Anaerolineaceae bacterium]|nr:tetratricopeptide repeat protein [Anaerolineaceae bacterium]
NLGLAWADLGEPRRAIEYYEQARALAQAIGDRQNEAIHSWNLGLLLEQQGELPRSVELMQICVDYERYIGHPDAEKDAAVVEQIQQKLK